MILFWDEMTLSFNLTLCIQLFDLKKKLTFVEKTVIHDSYSVPSSPI